MHFNSYIRSAIPGDSTLLYAILEISSIHREVTAGILGCKSVEYEQRCLEDLIPSLTDSTKTMPEQPTEAGMNSTHAVTAPVLMQIQKGNLQASSLSDAAMIVALRQEIFVANMTKRAVGPIAECCGIETSLVPGSDATWAYRIIVLAARVTNFVYGDDKKSHSMWNQLWQDVHDWGQHQPDSFKPIYSNMDDQPSNCFLYKIYYVYDCPIAVQQYFQPSRILLLAHDPQTLALGIG
ncbi:hypothetical protein FOPG_16117 [Fusarium oxysporum f. sp. conglutinans race 2 54008]|uniref:Transcription factor domain-containing protein n=1 Tax=Fusarium oxysporum f. sp. conglutinans race 2 54008 TaxID=1089457 RepID=X0I3A4_FUSOX|nr:hypothetical protein FOPG_16117 [Fusarium oxysporum f. sp. conglutinans race 2 54008]